MKRRIVTLETFLHEYTNIVKEYTQTHKCIWHVTSNKC